MKIDEIYTRNNNKLLKNIILFYQDNNQTPFFEIIKYIAMNGLGCVENL